MPDSVVVNRIEGASEAPSLSLEHPVHVDVARYISILLAPAVVSVPLVVLIAVYHERDLLTAGIFAGITLLFLSFGPFAYILLGVRLGKFSDVDISLRSQRTMPFLFGLVSVTLGLVVLLSLHGPKDLETILLGAAASGLIMMVTTWWWKISIHAATLAGAITLLTAIYGAMVAPAFALLILVSWSRVVLRRHTLAQVVAGSLVAIALTLIIVMVRGV